MSELLVKVDSVSKKFCKNLKHSMLYGLHDIAKNIIGVMVKSNNLRPSEFWSINNISFDLRRGECLGLIGPNGAGKSTILKILNGIISPDKGRVEIRGRVGALIEIGTGFHPILTGRENIYISGSVLGFSRGEIDRKFEDIVDFSELGDFIDTPVKYYSSGMYVRLGFAIAAQMEPDIMLIDEVLAVGDFSFRQKCAEKINEVCKNASILLVSHNMRDVMMLCSRAIVLDCGRIAFYGPSEEAVDVYLDMMDAHSEQKLAEKSGSKENIEQLQPRVTIYGDIVHNKEKITNVQHRWIDRAEEVVKTVEHGAALTLEFSFKLLRRVDNLVVGVPIWDSNDNLITGISTDMDNLKIKLRKSGRVKGRLRIHSVIFNTGWYMSYIAIMDGKEFLYRNRIGKIVVQNMRTSFGVVTPEYNWDFD